MFPAQGQFFPGSVVDVAGHFHHFIRRVRFAHLGLNQHGTQNVSMGKIFFPGAYTDFPHRKGTGLFMPGQCSQNRCASGRHHFAGSFGNPQRKTAQPGQLHHGRGWNRHTPVGTVYPPGSFVHLTVADFLYPQVIQAHTRAHNIHNGIHRAHFVEMNFFRRQAMHRTFGFGQYPEDLFCHLSGAGRQIPVGQNLQNLRQAPVYMRMAVVMMVMMMVVVIMIVFVIMAMLMVMFVIVCMFVIMPVVMRMAVPIPHFVQLHVKIRGHHTHFIDPADMQRIPRHL